MFDGQSDDLLAVEHGGHVTDYDTGDHERLPTLITRLKVLEDKLDIPPDQRIPDKDR